MCYRRGNQDTDLGIENFFNVIMAENFPYLRNNMDIHVQEALRAPNRHEHKRAPSCPIIVKIPKEQNQERILKAARKKCEVTYKSKLTEIKVDLSVKTLKDKNMKMNMYTYMFIYL
jgi:hypothetical protein